MKRKPVVVVLSNTIPDFEKQCEKLSDSGYSLHSSSVHMTTALAAYIAIFHYQEISAFMNPFFEKWIRKAERREAVIKMLLRWLSERTVAKTEDPLLSLSPLNLETLENILRVESSGTARKYMPANQWVACVMKRIRKEILLNTISSAEGDLGNVQK